MSIFRNRNKPEQNIPGYYAHLDGLRAIAISLVLIEHFGGLLGHFISGGYYGVDLFFVISGFLITSILLKSRQETFGDAYKTFMGRRILRIFPVYYLALLVFYLADFSSARDDIGWLVSYLWNYQAVHTKNELFYLWSLSVEEQYYLFWPFLVLALRNSKRLLLTLTLLIVAIGYSQQIWSIFPSLSLYNYTGMPNRMGSLGLGSAGAIAILMGWHPRALYKNLTIEIVTLATLVWALVTTADFRFPVLGICSLILVLKAAHGEFRLQQLGRLLSSRPSTFIGRISYGIYVYHWPLGLMLTKYCFDPIWLRIDFSVLGPLEKLRWNSWIIKFPLFYAATLIVAYLSFRFFETPILGLKDRWFASATPAKSENS